MKNRFDQRVWGSDPCKYGNVAYIVHGEIYVLGAPWKETYASKNAKCDWSRTAMSSSILLSPFRILGSTLLSPGDFEHYPLKEILAFTTFCRRFFRSLRHARLTWIKFAFGVKLLLHPLVKKILDHGNQTSSHCFFKKILIDQKSYFSVFIFGCIRSKLCKLKIKNRICTKLCIQKILIL